MSDRLWRRGRPEPPECCLATASDCTTTHATQSHGDRRFALLYAESTDGISWVKPNLNLVEFEGSTENNIVGGVNGTTGTSVSRTTRNSLRSGLCPYKRAERWACGQVILDTQTATTGAGKWKSFGNQKGNPAHRIWLGTSESGTDFEVTKVHSTGGVPFAGASLDGHMNAIFDERCVLSLTVMPYMSEALSRTWGVFGQHAALDRLPPLRNARLGHANQLGPARPQRPAAGQSDPVLHGVRRPRLPQKQLVPAAPDGAEHKLWLSAG